MSTEEQKFRLNQEFEETTMDGRHVRTMPTRSGNLLILDQKGTLASGSSSIGRFSDLESLEAGFKSYLLRQFGYTFSSIGSPSTNLLYFCSIVLTFLDGFDQLLSFFVQSLMKISKEKLQTCDSNPRQLGMERKCYLCVMPIVSKNFQL